ncbi:hypothetical protein BLL40_04890 [Domibacillus mangrovi]|uniref:Uncharacterized protein n=1 Tax=Domibacillus mangrovi TaxID=1714354 RepID=A0A1Q5P5U8_9BACI|nr:hypothetical protein BLL40_04890 [Domibacillus mangrovi]
MTRAQMALIASRWVGNECKKDATSPLCISLKDALPFKDIAPDYWAFKEIEEASTNHIYQIDEDGSKVLF